MPTTKRRSARKSNPGTLSATMRAFLLGQAPPSDATREDLHKIRLAFLMPSRPTLVERLMSEHGESLPANAWAHRAVVPLKAAGQLIEHPHECAWLAAAKATAQ